jgi:acyl-CoA hydrolase
MPLVFDHAEDCVEEAIRRLGPQLVMGAPIGIGKPNRLVNAFYRRAQADPSIHLTLFSGLSLERPRAGSDLEQRFLGPVFERLFGNYEELDYLRDMRAGTLPDNVAAHEFYFRAGSMKGVASAQRGYVSSNYTHAARDMLGRGMNLLVQQVAARDGKLSLSSNTDVSLDLLPEVARRRRAKEPVVAIAQIHPDMPFMRNRAVVAPGAFDLLLDNPAAATTLFAPPNLSVSLTDYAIGLHASTLVRDGGTLQIGIGSLGDAIVHALRLRHQHPGEWRELAAGLGINTILAEREGGSGPFAAGLYGCSEMLVNGFLHLIEAGIVRRRVYEAIELQRAVDASGCDRRPDARLLDALYAQGAIGAELSAADCERLRGWGVFAADLEWRDGRLLRGDRHCEARLDSEAALAAVAALALGEELQGGIHMHGGFFLGPRDFYERLRSMPEPEAALIGMDSVRRINRIDEPALRELQRRHARFINTGMMVTLSGAVASDALESGEVVSGVGGQYNFVAQAHELPGARSLILLRATRGSGRALASNIVPRYGHCTIPRHLRDIVITEYGAADLRGRSDEEVVQALLAIADSRFQPQLLEAAKEAGKLAPDYEIPERHRANLPARIADALQPWRARGFLPAFPLGTDFTPEEVELGRSLKDLKALMEHPGQLLAALLRSFGTDVDPELARPYLERIGLAHPDTPRERIVQQLLLLELEERGVLRPI